jgi:hypothetical protein
VNIGIAEAPEDGEIYGRQNGAWASITFIGEAPQDGTPYAREN